jgi:ubiquinone/menaquinone biosynthesis C-methylase UbiE
MFFPKLMVFLLNQFFDRLYHPFAFTYDLVAHLVSSGRWHQWVIETSRFIDQEPVLELGIGPGHFQQHLLTTGLGVSGIDESRQMIRIAAARIQKELPGQKVRLTRCRAQNLPFSNGSFSTIVSTFPSSYIFETQTLQEIHRILKPTGKAIILISAWITGKSLPDRLTAFLFRVTGQSPFDEGISGEIEKRFSENGLSLEMNWLELSSSRLLFLITKKS